MLQFGQLLQQQVLKRLGVDGEDVENPDFNNGEKLQAWRAR
jgi:hypothetical protein